MMPSRSTWIKIAVGVAVVTLLYCMISMNRCDCKKKMGYSQAKTPFVTTVPIMRPEKFAEYEPEEEEEEEYYSDYIPAQEEREEYVDAADVYSTPEFRSELLE